MDIEELKKKMPEIVGDLDLELLEIPEVGWAVIGREPLSEKQAEDIMATCAAYRTLRDTLVGSKIGE